jgi:hypothetical protein
MSDGNKKSPTSPQAALDFMDDVPTEPSRFCSNCGGIKMKRQPNGVYLCPKCGAQTAPHVFTLPRPTGGGG